MAQKVALATTPNPTGYTTYRRWSGGGTGWYQVDHLMRHVRGRARLSMSDLARPFAPDRPQGQRRGRAARARRTLCGGRTYCGAFGTVSRDG
jgi:hypothetical protein